MNQFPLPHRSIATGLAACLAFGAGASVSAATAGSVATPAVNLADLTPRQRVAQLFLVAIYAPEGTGRDDALRLVGEHGIGGIVLQAGNNVFGNAAGAPLAGEIATLTGAFQDHALDEGSGIPLFVAVDHEGDGPPRTHLREGFTPLPSPMAIGATWSVTDAMAIGRIAGAELGAVGVNLLLGPVVDVLSDPRVDTGGDIGTRAFGGDPFWVAQLGRAYVAGVHEGGAGRVFAVAKHFPGHGGSDRLPDVEVATINKGIEALRGNELPPFEAVTRGIPGDPGSLGIADGLMTSHIRYQGLQGGIRRLTPPISFDREGLQMLLSLEGTPFARWRAAGGLIVSDSLGVPAVRLWFTQSGSGEQDGRFPNREIVRRALLAGHDILTIAQFAPRPAWSLQLANVLDAIDYLTAEYGRDPAIRERIDTAAANILRQKARLYPDWSPEAVRADANAAPAAVGSRAAHDAAVAVSQRAVTVWAQHARPERGDRLVVVTPGGLGAELACRGETCGLELARWRRLNALGPTWVEGFILEGYGPEGTGTVRSEDLASLTFCQLASALSAGAPPTETPSPDAPADAPATPAPADAAPAPPDPCDPPESADAVRRTLTDADWVIFAFGDLSGDAVRLLGGFLMPHTARLVSAGGGHLAVLSLGPPYYVDSTNLARLDAHISAYSKVPASIAAGIDALFGDDRPPGRSPVTVDDADYILSDRLEPDPSRALALQATTVTEPASALPARLALAIGPVLDRNANRVPDDTSIELQLDPPDAAGDGAVLRVSTRDGIARGDLTLAHGGRVAISAFTASGARSAEPLIVELPVPTATPTLAPAATPAGHGGAGEAPPAAEPAPARPLGPAALVWAFLGASVASAAVTAAVRGRSRHGPPHVGLVAGCGALGLYCAYALWRRGSPAESLLPLAADPALVALLGAALAALGDRAITAVGSARQRPRTAR